MKLLATIVLLIIMIAAASGCSPQLDQITDQDRAELNQLLEDRI